jgi:hypothetical protein
MKQLLARHDAATAALWRKYPWFIAALRLSCILAPFMPLLRLAHGLDSPQVAANSPVANGMPMPWTSPGHPAARPPSHPAARPLERT